MINIKSLVLSSIKLFYFYQLDKKDKDKEYKMPTYLYIIYKKSKKIVAFE